MRSSTADSTPCRATIGVCASCARAVIDGCSPTGRRGSAGTSSPRRSALSAASTLPVAELDAAVERDRRRRAATSTRSRCQARDVLAEPAALRRSDGSSVYTVAGSQLYTSHAVLAAEQTIARRGRTGSTAAACRRAGDRDGAARGDRERPRRSTTGRPSFVRELAGSGARCQLALAPAGTGKTTALRVLARAWAEAGGDVVALAPSAAAARVLGEATGAPRRHDRQGCSTTSTATADAAIGPTLWCWSTRRAWPAPPTSPGSSTHALEAGASVRLVGDDRQLAAIGAGGVLRDLAETDGRGHPRRPPSGSPTRPRPPPRSAIRDGSPAALDFYLDRGRVHVGDEHTALLSAYTAWARRPGGRAATRCCSPRPASRSPHSTPAPAPTASPQHDGAAGPEVQLADGMRRQRGRRDHHPPQRPPARHHRHRLGQERRPVDRPRRPRRRRRRRHPPRHRPARHAARRLRRRARRLGYAVTIHARPGRTADTCHTVLTGTGVARAALRRADPRPARQPRPRRAARRRRRARSDPPRHASSRRPRSTCSCGSSTARTPQRSATTEQRATRQPGAPAARGGRPLHDSAHAARQQTPHCAAGWQPAAAALARAGARLHRTTRGRTT